MLTVVVLTVAVLVVAMGAGCGVAMDEGLMVLLMSTASLSSARLEPWPFERKEGGGREDREEKRAWKGYSLNPCLDSCLDSCLDPCLDPCQETSLPRAAHPPADEHHPRGAPRPQASPQCSSTRE